ncbi:MAG: serine/threonine protein kinase [Gammaproteobacteria bacterium]|nr:serine/threonine protein kinase [Gammaproteobacteria bacterium]
MNIDGYTLEKPIGKGGMAMVYLAVQESLARPVALKIMNPIYSDSAEFSARFLGEGRLLAAACHPNIITIHDIGISNGYHFISMEYVKGGDLRNKLNAGVTPETATNYIETIASCLSVAHEAFIVHRDIKPANILFREDGTLLLTDFGIAKQLTSNSDLTVTGSMVGSPYYLSPEQAQGEVIDGRADIYSLGVLYYEMLTGEKPFKGKSDVDIAIKHITKDLPRLSDSLSAYRDILECMTQKDPRKRFPSCKSLLQALKELKETGKWSKIIATIPLPDVEGSTSNAEVLVTVEPSIISSAANIRTVMDGDRTVDFEITDEVTIIAAPCARVTRSSLAKDALQVVGKECSQVAGMHKVMGSSERSNLNSFRKNAIPAFIGGVIKWVISVSINIRDKCLTGSCDSPLTGKEMSMLWGGGGVITIIIASVITIFLLVSEPQLDISSNSDQNVAVIAENKSLLPPKLKGSLSSEKAQIIRLLKQAESALKQYQLTTPKETSAYTCYKKVLAFEPKNIEAQIGMDKIADKYYFLARKAEERWNYTRARQYVNTGLEVRPRHGRLLRLQQEQRQGKRKLDRSLKQGLNKIKGWFQ